MREVLTTMPPQAAMAPPLSPRARAAADDRHAKLVGNAHHGLNLGGIPREHHRVGQRVLHRAVVGVDRHLVGLGHDPVVANGATQRAAKRDPAHAEGRGGGGAGHDAPTLRRRGGRCNAGTGNRLARPTVRG